jgi:hypothetical protein
MNLIELRATGDWPFALELHPRINVLIVPDELRRERITQMLAAIVRGELAGLEGSIAVDTVRFDLEPDAIEILGIPPGIDTTIAARDLPGARSVEVARDQGDDAGQPPPSPPPSMPVPEHSADAAQSETLAQARAQLHELRTRLDGARQGDDGGRADDAVVDARAALETARAQLETLASRPAVVAVPPAGDEALITAARDRVAELEQQLHDAEGERRTKELALRSLPAAAAEGAVDGVETLLRELTEAASSGSIPSPEAEALADRWAKLQERRSAAVEDGGDGAPLEHPARRELDEARVELTRAQHGARPLYVTPDAADELDRAHSAVADAEDRAFRRLAGPLAKRRLESAKAAEAEILKRIGVSSYDAYLMRSSPGLVDADAQQQLNSARRRLAEAEAAWDAVLNESRSPEHQNVEAELDGVRHRASELLGRRADDETLEADLRAVVAAPDVGRVRAELVLRLTQLGVATEDDDDLHEAASAWLASVRAGRAERAELLRVVSDLDRRVDGLVRQVEQARHALQDLAPAPEEGQADDETAVAEHDAAAHVVAEAERALAEAEATAAGSHVRRQEILALESQTQELEASVAQLEQARLEATDAPSPIDQAPPAPAASDTGRVTRVDVSGVGAKDAELYVLARIAAQRSVGDAGPLPLIINDAFADFPPPAAGPVLDLLTRMSGIVQVIYITGDDAIRTWGERLGPEEAAVFRFAPTSPAA